MAERVIAFYLELSSCIRTKSLFQCPHHFVFFEGLPIFRRDQTATAVMLLLEDPSLYNRAQVQVHTNTK